MWLHFTEPVGMRACIERLGRRWFLQVLLRCEPSMRGGVRLGKHSLSLPQSFVLLRYPNELLLDTMLLPLGEFSYVFELAQVSSSASAASAAAAPSSSSSSSTPNATLGRFLITCQVPGDGSDDEGLTLHDDDDDDDDDRQHDHTRSADDLAIALKDRHHDLDHDQKHGLEPRHPRGNESARGLLSLSWPLDIHMISAQQDLHLVLHFPPHGFVNSFVPFTVRVLALGDSPAAPAAALSASASSSSAAAAPSSSSAPSAAPCPPQAKMHLLFELSTDSSLWMIQGKQKATCSLSPGCDVVFTCQLLPLVSGYLPVPSVRLKQARGDIYASSSSSSSFSSSSSSSSASSSSSSSSSEQEETPFPYAAYEKIHPSRILTHFASHQIYIYPSSRSLLSVDKI